MSFAFATAWLIALLVAGPLVAHLMRRGRAREVPFAATALVPRLEHAARHVSRIENPRLLAIRVILILSLALLGAAPLVRCEQPVLSRRAGGSVALALVLDDSASMRAQLADGKSRFETARKAALALLPQLRSDDTVAIVLGGSPARVVLLPTRSGRIVRRVLQGLAPSDRDTDMTAAVALARTTLSGIPTAQKRIVVLSDHTDFAGTKPDEFWVPVPHLATPVADCGIVLVRRLHHGSQVDLACSRSSPAGRHRRLELFSELGRKEVVQSATFVQKPGMSTVVIETTSAGAALEKSLGNPPLSVRLLGGDGNPDNDSAPLCRGQLGLGVMVVGDPNTGRAPTGGPSLVEQALAALDNELSIRPLAAIPTDTTALDETDLLLLDDPQPLPPAARALIEAFAARGGIAVAFLGPHAGSQQLVSLLSPFVEGRTIWQAHAPAGLAPESLTWLGASRDSLASLGSRGRALFDDAVNSQSQVLGRWTDGRVWLMERPLSNGKVNAVGLPLGLGWSELSLRPGFLALLSHFVDQSKQRGRSRGVVAGHPWRFFGEDAIAVVGPNGPLELVESRDAAGHLQRTAIPSEVGRYRVTTAGRTEERFVVLSAEELLDTAGNVTTAPAPSGSRAETHATDLSRFAAMVLLAVALLELLTSALGRGFGVWRTGAGAHRRSA